MMPIAVSRMSRPWPARRLNPSFLLCLTRSALNIGSEKYPSLVRRQPMGRWNRMKFSNVVGLSIVACGTALGADFDKPFQSHMADGTPYWVVICTQADECFEDAYKWCNG